MILAEINSTNRGSTGTIIREIAEAARENGIEASIWVPKSKTNAAERMEGQQFIGNRISRNLHLLLADWTGLNGCFSVLSTIRFLHRLKKLNPDIIHLHNLHNCYINLGLLFRFLKKTGIPVIWTLHDCWAFTGHCTHFMIDQCEKWKNGCHDCPQYRNYPKSSIDNSRIMWKLKKKWFLGVENLTIVTPSEWLADLVAHSFLLCYNTRVINNGIDADLFRPVVSECRARLGIPEDAMMLLGVAANWGERKGLDVFIELSKRLPKAYRIVLVGTDEKIDRILPEDILSIHRTQNKQEMAELYSAADVFVNPTREDNFPTTNLESISCGTPIVMFQTGGSPESIDETCGSIVPCNDIDALEREIVRVCTDRPFSSDACTKRAMNFAKHDKYAEYVQLFYSVCGNGGKNL